MKIIMEWISVKQEKMPLERFIIVQHPHGIKAIHFYYGQWIQWYSGKECEPEMLESITHWFEPKRI